MRRIAGRYDLHRLLGTGGMAEVWRAHDRRLDRAVAVKLLHRRAPLGAAAARRIAREAQAVARLSAPNIVAIYDTGTEDGDPYLVMELVDGVSVADLLGGGPLPVDDAVDVAAQVCAALAAAHAAGVVHRDIKPSNVLRTPAGVVKVVDFGIATVTGAAGGTLTETATVVGTSDYMAPERATGQAADARSDLYSVGCLLYAMLTGAPPFRGDDPVAVLYQHQHAPVRPVGEVRDGVPGALVDLVGELLAKDPADRPASAADVAARLRRDPGTATRVLPVAAAPVLRRVRRWLVPAAALVAAGVLVLAVALLPDDRQPPQQAAGPSPEQTRQTATTSAPAPLDSGTSPADRIAQVHDAVARQESSGNVDSDAAGKIREDLAKIQEKRVDGKPLDAARRVAELRRRLDELAREGKLTSAGHRALTAATDRLAAALPPAEPGGGGDGEDDDGGDDDEGGGEGQGRGRGKDG